ncbi:hypothetical protein ACO1KY_14520, partial [Staphylococcus aureus]
VLKENGISLADTISVEVVENTDRDIYIAVPYEKRSLSSYPAQLSLNSDPSEITSFVIGQIQNNGQYAKALLKNPKEGLKNAGIR